MSTDGEAKPAQMGVLAAATGHAARARHRAELAARAIIAQLER